MTSMSEEERLKAEIAKLSGAIQTHKQQQHHHQQQSHQTYSDNRALRGRSYYPTSSSSSYRGAHAGSRGGYHTPSAAGRGRGRGAASIPPRNRTLILNDSNAKVASPCTGTTASSSSATDTADTTGTAASASTTASTTFNTNPSSGSLTDGWVKRKSTHNMSLVSASTFQRTEPARLAALEATRKAKAVAKAASPSSSKKEKRGKPSKPSSIRRGDNMGEVVIDGVVFEFDPSGTKLVKKPVQPSASDDTAALSTSTSAASAGPSNLSSSAAVPLKTSINGQDYIRTKRGNLISVELLAKRKAQRDTAAKMGRLDKMVGQISAIQSTRNAASRSKPGSSRTLDAKKARTLCTFFNKTGQCKRGLSCPYLHDSSKIALCPKVLRPNGCTLPKGTCPLSHTPRAERVPHCVHYLRTGNCRNGDECLYTHSNKLKDGINTKICRDFSEYGWCQRGGECTERHTYECPDFVEKGNCDKKGCKLVHVIRARDPKHGVLAPNTSDPAYEEAVEGETLQDGDLFMRDDAAAAEESESEHQEGNRGSSKGKRKRPLMQTELDDDQQLLPSDDDDGLEEGDEQVNFANMNESRAAKRRKAKAFTQQKDFISFDDEDEDGYEEQTMEDQASDVNRDEQLEVGSVHSEDFELSDSDSDSDSEDEAEDQEDQEGRGDTDDEDISTEEHANPTIGTHSGREADKDADDDDDLVDRDL